MRKGHQFPGGVRVQVKGKNLSITPALHDQVVHKMRKLDKYLDQLSVIEIELGTEKTREAGHHNHVEATTRVAGRTIRVITSHADMHAAIDEAVDKLYRQLNRTKERIKSHHNSKLSDSMPSGDEEIRIGLLEEVNPGEPIVVTEYLDMKPQFEDEAILELMAQRRTFHVFLNARNERVNVLYRHGDGTYGLIEPRSD
jgi:putative sigma-54 modulation protein